MCTKWKEAELAASACCVTLFGHLASKLLFIYLFILFYFKHIKIKVKNKRWMFNGIGIKHTANSCKYNETFYV